MTRLVIDTVLEFTAGGSGCVMFYVSRLAGKAS